MSRARATTRRRQPVPTWMRAGVAARLLDVNPSTVWRWCQDGTIPEEAQLTTGHQTRVARWWVDGRKAVQP